MAPGSASLTGVSPLITPETSLTRSATTTSTPTRWPLPGQGHDPGHGHDSGPRWTDPNPANWSSDAFAINDNNIVVGDTYNSTENGGFNVAMAWKWNGSNGGTMVDLNTISGGPGADSGNGNSAYAINDNDQVTGYSNTYAANLGYPTALIENVTNAFGGSPASRQPGCRDPARVTPVREALGSRLTPAGRGDEGRLAFGHSKRLL